MKLLMVTRAVIRQSLAEASAVRETRAGSRAWPALSNRVCPTPMRKAIAHSTPTLTAPRLIMTARPNTTSARHASAIHMTVRLSARSVIAPAIIEVNNQGSCPANDTAATAMGSREIAAVTNGNAAIRTPSPRVDTAEAVHSTVN